MYCRAGQQTEEEMYNNEEGGPAFNEFLDLLGQRVRLKGFNKYKAGLCNKSKYLNCLPADCSTIVLPTYVHFNKLIQEAVKYNFPENSALCHICEKV